MKTQRVSNSNSSGIENLSDQLRMNSSKMGQRKFLLTAIVIIMIITSVGTSLHSQETIPATGGHALGSGGSVSYSVGQVLYQTCSGTTGSVTQGVQQPYEISVATALEESKGLDLVISAFPNPITDYLQLIVESNYSEDLTCQLYDITGKLIETVKIENQITSISMSNRLPGIYLLRIILEDKELATFKIIKNH